MSDKRIPGARIRALWLDQNISVAEAGAAVGLTRSRLSVRAKALGLPSRKLVAGRRMVLADLRRFWADAALTNAEIAARMGYCERYLSQIARKLGLPPRPLGPKLRFDQARFARLWLAGVSCSEMARLFGRDQSTLSTRAKRLGLPPRHSGWQPKTTLAEAEMAAALAVSARETRDVMALAEMSDGVEGRRKVRRAA